MLAPDDTIEGIDWWRRVRVALRKSARRCAHLRGLRHAKQRRERTKQKVARLFVLIAMIAGVDFTSLRSICAFLDVPILAESTFPRLN
jgi:hypothetical protein